MLAFKKHIATRPARWWASNLLWIGPYNVNRNGQALSSPCSKRLPQIQILAHP